MNKTDNDILIDEFLAKKPLKVSDDFCDKLESVIESEKLADKAIDDFVSAMPIVASAGFSDKVLAAVAAFRRREIFKRSTAFVGAFAASIALSYVAFFGASSTKTNAQKIASEIAYLDVQMSNFSAYASELESFNADFYDYDLSLYKM